MICCTAMIPIYNRLKIKKIYLANLIILQNCIGENLIPWGGPTARVMSVMNLDAGELLAPLVPGMALSAVYVIGVSYYLGLKERKRLGIMDISNSVNTVELSDEEREWKRPKMILFNLLPHGCNHHVPDYGSGILRHSVWCRYRNRTGG